MDSTCDNCGVGHGPDDMFCENCGYDFITGSLPPDTGGELGVAAPPTPSTPAPESDQPADLGQQAVAPSVLDADPVSGPSASAEVPVAEVPRFRIAVAVDRAYFDEVVNDGEIEYPDPPPAVLELELAGTEIHVGRTSESRAIHPDIDVADLTGDQAVSSRHAVIRVTVDGVHTVVDVGSTNGTFVATPDSKAISQGVPIEVKVGAPIFLGAWTKLTILG